LPLYLKYIKKIVKYINIIMKTPVKSLDFLDNKLKIPEPLTETKEKTDVVETVLGFMDELFTTIFMKDYYENIKNK
jgi:hypothetical protein